MSLYLQGQLYSYLSIDGSEYPLSSSADQLLVIRDNVKQLLPTVELIIPDYNNLISGKSLVSDGTRIGIQLGDGSSNNPSIQYFTAFGTPKRVPYGSGNYLSIYGILDGCADLVRASVGMSFTGTSYMIMNKAAQKFNLKFNSNCTSTSDSMTWRGSREHWGNFLKYVTAHGYSQAGSFMSFAIDSSKNLYYNDVSQCMKSTSVSAIFCQGDASSINNSNNSPVYQVIEYRAANNSGLSNNTNAYGMHMSQFNSTTGAMDTNTTVTAHKPSGMALDINQAIRSSVSQAPRVLIPAINTGNTHDNYIVARHQNERISDTYSQNVYIMASVQTNLPLYSKVYFQAMDGSGNIDNSTAGNYLITGKARAIRGSRYYEKLELTSTGPQGSTGTM